jgi:hypothetical protein
MSGLTVSTEMILRWQPGDKGARMWQAVPRGTARKWARGYSDRAADGDVPVRPINRKKPRGNRRDRAETETGKHHDRVSRKINHH